MVYFTVYVLYEMFPKTKYAHRGYALDYQTAVHWYCILVYGGTIHHNSLYISLLPLDTLLWHGLVPTGAFAPHTDPEDSAAVGGNSRSRMLAENVQNACAGGK